MKTITVKGIGSVLVKPDFIVLSLSLESTDKDYETAMQLAASKITELNKSLELIGFEKESVKTTDFNVRTEYENRKYFKGDYHRVFVGYTVRHRLKISFDFDTKMLAKALGAIASCVAEPELSVGFTVKDSSAVNEELLRSAAQNAKKKAEVLCTASGAILVDLVTIDYNWGEINVYSRTRYEMDEDCLLSPSALCNIDIEPDDIDVNDTVTFVWQIN